MFILLPEEARPRVLRKTHKRSYENLICGRNEGGRSLAFNPVMRDSLMKKITLEGFPRKYLAS